MKNIFPYIIICTILISCYTRFSNNQFSKDFNLSDSTVTLAVLDLEYSGSFISSKNMRLAADYITSELYVEKNVNIVDRSLVKNVLRKYENSKGGKYSQTDLNNIGKELNATHLALGSLNSLGSIEDFYETGKRKINLTLRILNSSSGDVVGILRHQKQGESDIDELIKITVREMIQLL